MTNQAAFAIVVPRRFNRLVTVHETENNRLVTADIIVRSAGKYGR
jgi:hypothetical protein